MAGELVSLGVQTLWDLLSQEYQYFEGVEDQVSELKSDLNLLKSFLKDAYAKKHTSALVRYCVEEIKEIVYDAEDIIEEFVQKERLGKTSGNRKRIKRLACIILDRRENALYMGGISKRISRVIRDMQSFGLHPNIDDDYMKPLRGRQRERRQEFSRDYESNLVGMEANVKRLVNYLVEEDDIQIVTVTGMGGLGKTTLARNVFNHEDVKRHFNGLAWVCVSQDFTLKTVWQKILGYLKPNEEEKKISGDHKRNEEEKNILEMTEEKFQEKLFGLLETNKSLIVLDDIWEKSDWESIKKIFPNTKGWKVLLTSRNESIAGPRNTTVTNLKPDYLNTEDSWTLFQRIALPIKDESQSKVYEEMEEMGKQMIKHCGGLPLAIKVLGGLLAENYTRHDWKRLSENIGSHLVGGRSDFNDDNNNSCNYVLSMSFEDLPSSLKHCFLYLAHFPEDHKIEVEKLYYYWAAEGLFEPRHYDGETIQDIGDVYMEELVRRNMVIAERESTTERFETCHLHDMMREICLLKAKQENFLQITSSRPPTENFQSPATSRRFVSQYPTKLHVERNISNPKLRSLVVVVQETPWRERWELSGSSYTRLELLRVLDLCKAKLRGRKLVSGIGKLIHLRYLSLKDAEVSHLPSSLRNLKLIYLNLDTYSLKLKNTFVPNVLMGMQELRYLALPRCMHKKTKLELRNLEKLETLKNFSTKNSSVEDLRGMFRLRTLKIMVTENTSMKTLSESIGSLRHLEYLKIKDPSLWLENFIRISGGISMRRKREEVVLDFKHPRRMLLKIYMPRQNQFPSQLTFLQLGECMLEEDPMPILEKLVQLKELQLVSRSFMGRGMVCSSGWFPQLQKLYLDELVELEEWIVEEGSMPLLHTLTFRDCPKLKELPSLRFISSLKDLTVDKKWKERLSEEGEDYDKVKHIPSIKFCEAYE